MQARAVIGVVALMGWSACCEPRSSDAFKSVHGMASIAARGERAMIAWERTDDGFQTMSLHAAALSTDGLVSDERVLDPSLMDQWNHLGGEGVAGSTRVFWGHSDQCQDAPGHGSYPGRAFTGWLVPYDGASPGVRVDVTDSLVGSDAIVFDGSTYHAFWIEAGRYLRHRTFDETGVLGPVDDLDVIAATTDPGIFIDFICLSAASDGAGHTLVTVAGLTTTESLLLDATGVASRVWQAPPGWIESGQTFWLAGEMHVLSTRTEMIDGMPRAVASAITSINPVTGDVRARDLPPALLEATVVGPSETHVYMRDGADVVQLDPNLQITATFEPNEPEPEMINVLGRSAVVLASQVALVETSTASGATPGRIQTVKLDDRGLESWRVDVDVDSHPYKQESPCNQTH